MSEKEKSAEVISIMSHNSEIAYRMYKQKFNDAMDEYRVWKKESGKDYPAVIEWQKLMDGYELRQKAEMWLGVCVRIKEHMNNKKMMCL